MLDLRSLFLGVLYILILTCIFNFIQRKRRIVYFAQKHRCESAKRYPQKETLLGLGFFLWTIRVTKDQRRMEETKTIYEQLGHTWQVSLFGRQIINTIDPVNIRTVMASNFNDWALAPLRYPAAAPFMGRGVFTSDGSFWHKARGQIKPVLSKAQFADFSRLETHLQELITLIPTNKQTVDILPLLERLFTDVVTEFLLGESVETLTKRSSLDHQAFLTAFENCAIGVGKRILFGKFRVLFRDRKFESACRATQEYVERRIDETYKMLDDKPQDLAKEGEPLIFIAELAKQTSDRVLIRDQVINVLNAANDGAAIVVSHILFFLSRHVQVQAKLRRELAGLEGRRPDYDTLKSMKYLRYIINETLRIYPLVPTNNRMALKDTILPRGGGTNGESPLFVEKGSIYSTNSYVLHRDKQLWGEDSEEFCPERWETHRQGWEYQAFGGGPRTCPGQALVLTEIGYTVVRLLQTYQRIDSRDDKPWVEKLKLTMSNSNGINLGFIR